MKLEAKNLSGGYGRKKVLEDLSFAIAPGSITTLLGPNGCGKSTLLKMLGRILKPESGSILLDGQALATLDTATVARQMAVLPQVQQPDGEMTVEELVTLGRFPHRRNRLFLTAQDRKVIDNVIALTRLEELRNRVIGTLSGGERQRAWIAMVLAQEPQVLLLDEPTTFLDICCQYEIIELVKKLHHELGITVVMVLHDLNVAAACSDRLLLIRDRQIRYAGTPYEVVTQEVLREIFEIETQINYTSEKVPYCLVTGSTRGRS